MPDLAERRTLDPARRDWTPVEKGAGPSDSAEYWVYCSTVRSHEWSQVAQVRFGRAPDSGERRTQPYQDLPEELFQEFVRLRDQWVEDTMFESSTLGVALHPGYQRIIGMGKAALPLILADLATQARPWFWALRAIVGRDVAEGAETMDEAQHRWLDWGHSHGLV